MRTVGVIIVALGIFMASIFQASAQDENALSYRAYLSTSLTLWEKDVQAKESAFKATPDDMEVLYQLALAQYGLLNATIATENEDVFNKYLDSAKGNLETLIGHDDNWAEPKAILSSVYGLQMGFSPWKGMFLGSKSTKLIEQALGLNEASPIVTKLYAGSKLFTPEMFGGDVKEAIKYYLKCIELYESDATASNSKWLYLDAFAFLGLAYEKDNEDGEALKVYTKALEHEAQFAWVKNVLLPNVENKLAEQL